MSSPWSLYRWLKQVTANPFFIVASLLTVNTLRDAKNLEITRFFRASQLLEVSLLELMEFIPKVAFWTNENKVRPSGGGLSHV